VLRIISLLTPACFEKFWEILFKFFSVNFTEFTLKNILGRVFQIFLRVRGEKTWGMRRETVDAKSTFSGGNGVFTNFYCRVLLFSLYQFFVCLARFSFYSSSI
jgi:hypothetical protein